MEFESKLEYDFHNYLLEQIRKCIDRDEVFNIQIYDYNKESLDQIKEYKYGRFHVWMSYASGFNGYVPHIKVYNLKYDNIQCLSDTIKTFETLVNDALEKKQDHITVTINTDRTKQIVDIMTELPF